MLNVQKHRGPDDSGIRAFSLTKGQSIEVETGGLRKIDGYFEGILGFNRLSILDLSANGHQPMESPDKRVLLVLNGEIYNAFDFKNELKEWGYSFKSTSDTEIVLALYLRYGFDGLLERLNGMFAIVIADLGRNELFITRDRFGIKPMYYISTGTRLAFSSEIKSFKYLENFTFRLDEDQLDEFLLFRNNLSDTLYRDVLSLTPGYYLNYSPKNGLLKKRYFNINDYMRSGEATGDIESFTVTLEKTLAQSVKSQLMSDVKLGCQLSGGIDSSLVTWLANRNNGGNNFEAVSIIFNDKRFSEERYIDIVTDKLEIPSHKFLLDPGYYFENFERATWHFEAPLNHPNTIAIYKLSQRAKEYVTVLLSGEGADEVFGGYERFYQLAYPFRMRKLLSVVKKYAIHPDGFTDYFDQTSRAIMATSFMIPSLAAKLRDGFSKERATSGRRTLYMSLSGSLFDKQVKYEINSYLPDLLLRQDKMSMAHSIENRVPFLDNTVVETAFTIPENLLLLRKSAEGSNTEKYLLKKMTSKIFGNDFAFRNKMGFGIPVREFLMDRRFSVFLNDKVIPGIKRRGIFNYKLASEWFSKIGTLKYFELDALWVMVSFEVWASLYLDNNYENSNSQY